MKVTTILDQDGIKELIAREYKVDPKEIRFVGGFGFISAIFENEEDDNENDN